jgi:choice-of-anchor B domain-containing protein
VVAGEKGESAPTIREREHAYKGGRATFATPCYDLVLDAATGGLVTSPPVSVPRLVGSRPAFAALVASLALLGAASALAIPTRNLQLVAQFNHFPPLPGSTGYASCWHYVHGDGREYAVIGTRRGIAIYNVTNPFGAYLVDSIVGPASTWREMKSYRNWIYVVTEATGTGAGLQIVRMTDPENPVLAATYTTTFRTAHTVTIDTTRALLFANGTRNMSGTAAGMRILSLANPEAPLEVGRWPTYSLPIQSEHYVHDAVVRGTTLYAASIYGAAMRVIDTANPTAPFETSSFSYSDAHYPHNSWPDASGQYLYVTDETSGMPLSVFDISSYATPLKLPVYEWTANAQAIVHNAHVRGDELWIAHYTEGAWGLDATDPRHPAPFAFGDTYAGPTGGFNGCWGIDPYLPSGLVIASDMQTGLYVFQVDRNYGRVTVEVVDGVDSSPMDSAMVYCTTSGDSAATPFWGDGKVAFAPSPGLHTIDVKRFGWTSTPQNVTVTQGSAQTIQIPMFRKPTSPFSGIVRSATTQAVLPASQVDLLYTSLHEHTSGAGAFQFEDVPDDFYRVAVRRPGSIPVTFDRRIGASFGEVQDFQLQPAAIHDDLSTGAGWSVTPLPGESHVQGSGKWTRVEPYGTTQGGPAGPGPASPAASRPLPS